MLGLSETTLRFTLFALALGVAALELPRVGLRMPAQVRRLALPILAVLAVGVAVGPDLWRFTTTPWVRAWNVYHYYLGPKYFAELGYLDLYRASLVADAQGAGQWRRIERVRNLGDYTVLERDAELAGYEPSTRFTHERWREFQRDVQALAPQLSERTWRSVFRDRGYNATPFWTAVVRPLVELLPASNLAALKILTALDLLLLVATFVMLGRAFGRNAALWVLVLFVLTPVNHERIVGGVLQYDWFCSLAAGLAFLKQRRMVPAGLALAFATLARVFPVLLVAAALAPALLRWLRRGRLARPDWVFAATFALAGLVGAGLGAFAGRGLESWFQFADKIGFHTEEHVYGEQRIGLKHALTRDLGSHEDDPSSAERRQALAQQSPLYLGLAAVLLLSAGAGLAFRRRTEGLLLGLVPVFVLTVASRYYWSTLALLPTGRTPRSRPATVFALLAGQILLYAGLYALQTSGAGRWGAYNAFNFGLTAFFLAWTLLWANRNREGLKALRRRSPRVTKAAGTRVVGRHHPR